MASLPWGRIWKGDEDVATPVGAQIVSRGAA
jgi:hypothetical protein